MVLLKTHKFEIGQEYTETLERVWFQRQALINLMTMDMNETLASKLADKLENMELQYLLTWDKVLRDCCDTSMDMIGKHYSHPTYSCDFYSNMITIDEYICPNCK